jgi:hypothetical protein
MMAITIFLYKGGENRKILNYLIGKGGKIRELPEQRPAKPLGTKGQHFKEE